MHDHAVKNFGRTGWMRETGERLSKNHLARNPASSETASPSGLQITNCCAPAVSAGVLTVSCIHVLGRDTRSLAGAVGSRFERADDLTLKRRANPERASIRREVHARCSARVGAGHERRTSRRHHPDTVHRPVRHKEPLPRGIVGHLPRCGSPGGLSTAVSESFST